MSHGEVTARIPLIHLREYVLVSIQTALTDQMVLQIQEDIATEIQKTGVKGLIIDVSGIDLMDSFIARSLRDVGLIAQLMGVETVLSGIAPMIAITLVEMGMELTGVSVAGNLDGAITMLDRKLAADESKTRQRMRRLLGLSDETTGASSPHRLQTDALEARILSSAAHASPPDAPHAVHRGRDADGR